MTLEARLHAVAATLEALPEELVPVHLVDLLEEARWILGEARATRLPWRRVRLKRRARTLIEQAEQTRVAESRPTTSDPAFA